MLINFEKHMKKLALSLFTLLIILFAIPPLVLGFNIWHLGHAVKVATSLSAKIACSGHFISGFSESQIRQDLSSYSPVTQLVELDFNKNKRVTANLYGLAETVAEFDPRYGCSVKYKGYNKAQSTDSQTPQSPRFLSDNSASGQSWPQGSARDDIDIKIQQGLDQIRQRDNQQGLQSRAMVVIKDGKLVAESYASGFNNNTLLLGWSMAKSVIAMTEGRAEYLEILNPQQNNLFETWQDQRKEISVEQLLTMTSGLDFSEDYAPGSDATRMLFTVPSTSDVALQSTLAHKPGSHFSYSSGTSNLLARYLVQSFNDKPESLYTFMDNELLKPLGIKKVFFEPDASGIPIASSYLFATAEDWARLGWLMANQGQINNQRLLSADWVKRATSPNQSENEKAYGYQFWLNRGDDMLRWPQLPEDAYAMMGNRKQFVMIIPSERLVFVRLGWSSGEYPMAENTAELLRLF